MYKHPHLLYLAIALGVSTSGAFAQSNPIPVVDASPSGVNERNTFPRPVAQMQTARPAATFQGGSADPVDLLYSLELLQQEVLELRGMVEDQAYQIKQMREEQRDRYLDLDRRIGLMSSAGNAAGSYASSSSNGAPSPSASALDDKSAYQAAFELIRKKRYEEAVSALMQFTQTYGDSSYSGNAYYWLGEVQLVQGNSQDALQAFGLLLNKYPDHRKIPDAKYKLGKVYRELGDDAKAKTLLQEVVDRHSGTSAAKLAASELRNFQ